MKYQNNKQKNFLRNISSFYSEYNPSLITEKSLPCFIQSLIQLDPGTTKNSSALLVPVSHVFWLLLRVAGLLLRAPNPVPSTCDVSSLRRFSWVFCSLQVLTVMCQPQQQECLTPWYSPAPCSCLLQPDASQMFHNIMVCSKDIAQCKEPHSFHYATLSSHP